MKTYEVRTEQGKVLGARKSQNAAERLAIFAHEHVPLVIVDTKTGRVVATLSR